MKRERYGIIQRERLENLKIVIQSLPCLKEMRQTRSVIQGG